MADEMLVIAIYKKEGSGGNFDISTMPKMIVDMMNGGKDIWCIYSGPVATTDTVVIPSAKPIAKYRVTTKVLNVRAAAWTGTVTPAVVSTLAENDVFDVWKVDGVWGAIDEAGTRWVNTSSKYAVKI